MITNDIQELLDGSLSDERAAELLHALSVSPERRTEFRQFMALKGEMDRDRYEAALTPEEDAKAWRGIAAVVGGAPTASAPVSSAFSWIGRAVAFALVGIGGYFLGSSQLVPGPDQSTVSFDAGSSAALLVGVDRFSSLMAGLLPEPADMPSTVDTVRVPVNRIVYRDRWRENVKIVYRDKPATTIAMAPTKRIEEGGVTPPTENRNAQEGPSSVNVAHGIVANQPPDIPDSTAAISQKERQSTPIASADSSDANRSEFGGGMRQPGLEGRELPLAPMPISGVEVAYSERVGRLVAPPRGQSTSTSYGGRYVDLGYRLGESGFGLGFRIGYGSFSAVTLVPDQTIRRDGAVSRIDTIYRPHVDETKGTPLMELFLNYRLPVTERLSVGAEASYNTLSTHQKLGLDLLALLFLTDRVGLQVGGGLSHYWYDLGAERLKLLQSGENVGVSDDALDSYSGNVLEGRYGLIYRF